MSSSRIEKHFEKDILSNIEYKTTTGEKYNKEQNRNLTEPIYKNIIKNKLIQLNDDINEKIANNIINKIESLYNTDKTILEMNTELYELFSSDHEVLLYNDKEESDKKKYATIISDEPDENEFVAVRQFEYQNEHNKSAEFDIAIFLNGFPIVIKELKNIESNKTTRDAVKEIKQYYQNDFPEIFYSNVFCVGASEVVIDSSEIKSILYGPIGAPVDIYKTWDVPDEDYTIEKRLAELVSKDVLLNYINYYTTFRKENNGITKYIARYHQYFTAERIYENYIQNSKDKKDIYELIFNIQGSGKSIIMQFVANKIQKKHNLKVLIIIDSDNLNTEMQKKFNDSVISSIPYTIAESTNHLRELLISDNNRLILTTIQKFEDINSKLCTDQEVVTLEDEVHRYMDGLWGENKMRALDGSYTYGFTGTPNERSIKQYTKDGEFLYVYPMSQAIEDDIICEFSIERINLKYKFSEDIESSFDTNVKRENKNKKEILSNIDNQTLSSWNTREEFIAKFLINDYKENLHKQGFNAMFTVQRRSIANEYTKLLQKEAKKQNLDIEIKPIYTEQDKINKISDLSLDVQNDIERFKNEDNKLRIVVVVRMLLTGFDSNLVKKLYVDRSFGTKSLLMQAVSRTNRPNYDKGKLVGEIMDFTNSIHEDDLYYTKNDLNYIMTNKNNIYNELETTISKIRKLYDLNDVEINKNIDNLVYYIAKNNNHSQDVKNKFSKLFENLDSYWSEIQPDPERLDEYRQEYIHYKKLYVRYNIAKQKAKEVTRKESEKITHKTLDENAIIDDFDVEKEEIEMNNELKDFYVDSRRLELEEIINRRKRLNPEYDNLLDILEKSRQEWNCGEINIDEYDKKLSEISNKSIIDNQSVVIEKAIMNIIENHNNEELKYSNNKEELSNLINEVIEDEILSEYDTSELIKKSDKERVIKKLYVDLYSEYDILLSENEFYEHCIQKAFNIYKNIETNPNI